MGSPVRISRRGLLPPTPPYSIRRAAENFIGLYGHIPRMSPVDAAREYVCVIDSLATEAVNQWAYNTGLPGRISGFGFNWKTNRHPADTGYNNAQTMISGGRTNNLFLTNMSTLPVPDHRIYPLIRLRGRHRRRYKRRPKKEEIYTWRKRSRGAKRVLRRV